MRSKSIDTMNEILDFINKTFFLTREVPSVQEIADKVGIAKSSASRYLAEMETRGMIFKSSTFYGLETQKMRKAMRTTCFMPIVGEIACGTPILAEEHIESYFPVPVDMVPNGEPSFILKVKGDSMINVGIYNGDQVFVQQCHTANNGEIIVALIDDSATVKTFYRENGHIRLQPENDTMDPIIVNDCQILGKVFGVFRFYR